MINADEDRLPEDKSAGLLIAAYAAYCGVLPLAEVWPSYSQWNDAFLAERHRAGEAWPFWKLWRLTIAEPRRERQLSAAIDSSAKHHECVVSSGSISCDVRSMYELSPYPKCSRDPPPIRWPAHPLDWLQAVGFMPPVGWPTATERTPMKVLWAGCGTGYVHAHHLSAQIPKEVS
jgi:hypothetical protein